MPVLSFLIQQPCKVEEGLFASSCFSYELLELGETKQLTQSYTAVNDKPELLALASCPITELFSMPLFLVITSHL